MSYHDRIKNLESPEAGGPSYQVGFADAQDAAAEIANEADREIEELKSKCHSLAKEMRFSGYLVQEEDGKLSSGSKLCCC